MRFTVIFRKEARDEALRAAEYIAAQGDPATAARWLAGLEQLVETLQRFPRRFSHAREQEAFPAYELRQVVYHSHRIIYTVTEDTVHILHVRHTAQISMEELDG